MKLWIRGLVVCLLFSGTGSVAHARSNAKSILGWIPFAKGYSYKILEGHPGAVIVETEKQQAIVYVFQANVYSIGYGLTQVPIVVDERCVDSEQSMEKCKRRQWMDIVVDRSQQRGLPPNHREMKIRHPIRAREVTLQCLVAGGRVEAEQKVQTDLAGEAILARRWTECATIEVREPGQPAVAPVTTGGPAPLP